MRHLLPLLMLFSGMALTRSEAAYAGILRLRMAIGRAGIPRKVVAEAMGVSEARLSEILAFVTPLSFSKLCELFAKHPEIEQADLELRAEQRGDFYRRRDDLCRMVDAVQALTAIQHERKPMAKMTLRSEEREEECA